MLDGGERVDAVPLPAGILRVDGTVRRRTLQARAQEAECGATTRSRTAPFAASAGSRELTMNGRRRKPPEGWSLERWSRLKREAAREKDVPAAPPVAVAPPAIAAAPSAAHELRLPAAAARADALPPVESLTIDSDFSAFLQPKVDEALKRQALKKLFRDPRFNVMDGLDVYIDDYSKPDPIDARRRAPDGAGALHLRSAADARSTRRGSSRTCRRRARRRPRRNRSTRPADPSIAAGDQVAVLQPQPAPRMRRRRHRRTRDGAGVACAEAAASGRPIARSVGRDEPRRQDVSTCVRATARCRSTRRRSRARSSSRALRTCGRCCARRSSPRSPAMRPATSSSPARRRRGSSATSRRRAARRRRSGSSTSAKPAAGRRKPRPRRRRSPRCSRWPGCPSPRRCRASRTAPKAGC